MMEMAIPTWAFYAVLGLAIALLVYQLHRIMDDRENDIEWWQFISSRGRDGKQYADMTKLGQATGIFVCAVVPLALVARRGVDLYGFAAVLLVILAYLGGVQSYQTYMKSRGNPQPQDKPKEKDNA